MSFLYTLKTKHSLALRKSYFFNTFVFSKFINLFTKNGFKSKAFYLVHSVFFILRKSYFFNSISLFFYLVRCLLLKAEVKPISLAGRTVNVPFPLSYARQLKLSAQLLYKGVSARSERSILDRLQLEILNTIKKRSKAYQLWVQANQLVVSSRAFSHFRWQ